MGSGYNVTDFVKRIKHTLTGNKYLCQFIPIGIKLINYCSGNTYKKITKDAVLSKLFTTGENNIGIMAKTFSFSTITNGTVMLKSRGIEIPVPNSRQQGTLNIDIYNTGVEWVAIKKLGDLYYNQDTGYYGFWEDVLFNIEVDEFESNGHPYIKHKFINCTLSDYGSINLSYDDASSLETFNITVNFTDYTVAYNDVL